MAIHRLLFWAALLFFGLLGGFTVWIMLRSMDALDPESWMFLPFCALWLLIIVYFLYELLFGGMTPTYRLEPDAMVTRWRGREYRLRWADCVEYGYVSIASGRISSVPTVYFSDHWLEPKKKKWFMNHYRLKFEHIQYFEIYEENFVELLNVLPERLRSYLEVSAELMGYWDSKSNAKTE